MAIIAAAVIGAVVALVLIALVSVLVVRRRRLKVKRQQGKVSDVRSVAAVLLLLPLCIVLGRGMQAVARKRR